MSFQAPLFLLVLAIIPLLVFAYVRHERGAARGRAAFAPAALLPSVVTSRPGWRRHAGPGLQLAALAMLVLALARPERTVAVPVEQATVVLTTDRSGSMEATDVSPTRLAAARAAAHSFLDRTPRRIRVGLVAFNQAAEVVQTPTTDHATVRVGVDALAPSGGTATGDAITAALASARRVTRPGGQSPPAAIVLLSDGKSVRGRDPLDAAREARRAKVPVYTVALGTQGGQIEVRRRDGSVERRPVPPDVQAMRQIAQITGGRSYTALNAGALDAVYDRLGSQLATENERRQFTSAVAGGALALLALGAAASLRWFGRLV